MAKDKKSTVKTHSMQIPIKIIPNPYKNLASFEDGIFQFSFPTCLEWLENTGKDLFGSHFSILEEDQELINSWFM